MIVKEAFNRMVMKLKARETLKTSTIDVNTQMDTPVPTMASISIQTEATMSQHFEIDCPTCLATSQPSALFRNRKKNTKIGTTSENFSENSVYNTIISLTMPSVILLESTTPSSSTIALEMQSTTAGFIQNGQNFENSMLPNSSQTTPSPSFVDHTNNVTGVYMSPPTPNDAFLKPSTASTGASSPEYSQTSVSSGHKKSMSLCAVFKLQPPTESPALTSSVPALETHQIVAGFTKNHQKIKKSLSDIISDSIAPTAIVSGIKASQTTAGFIQDHTKSQKLGVLSEKYPKTLKSAVPAPFNWDDDAGTLPIMPTFLQYPPHDLSCLRSTSKHPFSSLQCRHGHLKKKSMEFSTTSQPSPFIPLAPLVNVITSTYPFLDSFELRF